MGPTCSQARGGGGRSGDRGEEGGVVVTEKE